MRIYRESLKKEHNNQKIYEDFKINHPQKVDFYAEKPNNNPFLLMKYQNEGRTINGVDMSEKLDDQMQKTVLTNEISDKLKTVTQVPKDKWQFPQTSNQEIGWYAEVIPYFIHSEWGQRGNSSTREQAAMRPTTQIVTTQ